MPKTLVRAVAAQSLTKPQPLIFSLTIQFLKSLSIKEKKVFSGRVYPHADQNGILIKSETLLELTTNLIMVAKLTDVAKLAGVSPYYCLTGHQ